MKDLSSPLGGKYPAKPGDGLLQMLLRRWLDDLSSPLAGKYPAKPGDGAAASPSVGCADTSP